MINQFRIVAGLLFLAILVYSGLWFTAAFEAERDTADLLSTRRDNGVSVEHGTIKHAGFPYRITVEVNDLRINTRQGGLTFSADKLVLNSHLWTANHWVAQGIEVQASFADKAIAFKDKAINASYKLYDDGQNVIAIDSLSTDDFTLTKFMGITPPNLDNWQLFLRYGNTSATEQTTLYGERYLDIKLTAKAGGRSIELLGGISGPVIKRWSKPQLANWRDEGGLLEISNFQLSSGNSSATGNLSLTLDEKFKPLGSASLTIRGGKDLSKMLDDIGLNGDIIPPSGPLNIMLQNGKYSGANNEGGKLKPIIK